MTTNAEGERFSYDAENHQTEYFDSSNSGSTPDATYYYDGEGRRVKKISSTETTVFVYDGGGQMIAEYSSALATTPQVSYLTQDHLGSPRVITDETGEVKDRKDFAAFGDETITAARSINLGYTNPADELREGYTGYEKDSESGLDFAQARYYNPTHGRFTSVDPMTASATIRNPQTFNRYSYVLNSPYKFVDPLGLISSSTGACGQYCLGNDRADGLTQFDCLSCRSGFVSWDPNAETPAAESQSNHASQSGAIAVTTALHEATHSNDSESSATPLRPADSDVLNSNGNRSVSSQSDPIEQLRERQSGERDIVMRTFLTMLNVTFGKGAYFDGRTITIPVKGMIGSIKSALESLFLEAYGGYSDVSSSVLIYRFANLVASFGGPSRTYKATVVQGTRSDSFHFNKKELQRWGIYFGKAIVNRALEMGAEHRKQRILLRNQLIQKGITSAQP